MSKTNDEIINRVVVEAAKLLAKDIKVDERQVSVLMAEILASDYFKTGPGYNKRHDIFKKAEEYTEKLIAEKIKGEIFNA